MVLAICLLAAILTLELNNKELSFDAMMLVGVLALVEFGVELIAFASMTLNS